MATALLTATVLGCDPATPPTTGADGGAPTRLLGESCTSSEDCATGFCLEVAPGRAVCTHPCSSDLECPAGPSWGCIAPEGFDGRVCGCSATSDEESCGDGLDNECNGRVDDCRICDGVPVPDDDPRNCGACGVSCRLDQECAGGSCRCPGGRTECGGACIDLDASALHCGACDAACPTGASCVAGECACNSTTPDLCGSTCTDTRTDERHCGACDEACESGLDCIGGECRCTDAAFSLHCPGVGCVDRLNDELHCGTCDNACPSAQSCVAGACQCPSSGNTLCGSVCVSTATDPANCGGCDLRCTPGARCSGGSCICDSGLTCDGTCVPYADAANCGACGRVCRADQRCNGTACECVWPTIECGGACIDPRYDELNCGACGNTCGTGQTCSSGICSCTTSGQTYCAAADTCVDLRTSAANCGSCGTACPAAQVCSASTCRCPSTSQTFCAASEICVDLRSDAANCGACGNACPGAQVCSFSACRCPISGQTYCASIDACIDTSSDDLHCGRCDNVCPAETTCGFGSCRCDAAGLSLCGSTCVDLQGDEANCGVCGRTCTGGRECLAGSCQCPAPVASPVVRLTTNATRSADVRIASNGARAMVVWTDGAAPQLVLVASDGMRVAGTETPLASSSGAGSPDVVWSGTEYGVAWYQSAAGVQQVMFQRFGADGIAIGSPVNVSAGWTGISTSTVATVRVGYAPGSGFALAVQPSTYSSDVYFQLLGADASSLPLPVRMPTGGGAGVVEIAGAPDGRFGVLYGMRFQQVNADGSVTAATVTISLAGLQRLAHDGETWVAAGVRSFYASSGSYRSQVYLLRGATLATQHVVYDVPAAGVDLDHIAMAVAGGVATLVWTDDTDEAGSRRLQSARVRLPTAGATYQVISPSALLMGDYTVADDGPPATTHVGTSGLMTAWPDTRWGQYEVYLQPATLGMCM